MSLDITQAPLGEKIENHGLEINNIDSNSVSITFYMTLNKLLYLSVIEFPSLSNNNYS